MSIEARNAFSVSPRQRHIVSSQRERHRHCHRFSLANGRHRNRFPQQIEPHPNVRLTGMSYWSYKVDLVVKGEGKVVASILLLTK